MRDLIKVDLLEGSQIYRDINDELKRMRADRELNEARYREHDGYRSAMIATAMRRVSRRAVQARRGC